MIDEQEIDERKKKEEKFGFLFHHLRFFVQKLVE
jgi:hypothetical protein